MSRTFSWPVRVYWEDTDAGGVVYHANYLKFMERARTEWLSHLGLDQVELERETGAVLVVHRIDCEFAGAARLGDNLDVHVIDPGVSGARMCFQQTVVKADSGQILIKADVTAACVDRENWRARRFPKMLLDLMK